MGGPPFDGLARSRARCVTRVQTKRLRSADSYVPADGTSAAPSFLRELRLSRNRQLGMILAEYSER